MATFDLGALAIPAVRVLIGFLGYTSQFSFLYLEPGFLTGQQFVIFNTLLIALWITYARSCLTDPGRIPKDWAERLKIDGDADLKNKRRPRWCRKCEAFKPPRAHHCKTCKRCIPKMDHHCPWTANCVSSTTFPHFIRFLFYAVTAMSYLGYFIYIRAAVVWENRNLPIYHGPSVFLLVYLFILIVVNSLTLFALGILLLRVIWSLGGNITTIEGWEIERHETLVRRARHLGGYLSAPDGSQIRIVKQEFPYDIGIFHNIAQGMGTWNVISWFWPLARTPSIEAGLQFEENGFEEKPKSWPPPDPDRIQKYVRPDGVQDPFTQGDEEQEEEWVRAVKQRQQADFERRSHSNANIQRRKPFVERLEEQIRQNGTRTLASEEDETDDEAQQDIDVGGEEAWKNSEGERLRDFGVDEDIEFYDEEDIPLGELMRRRQMQQRDRRMSMKTELVDGKT